jgi:hypothetical protein
MLAPFLVSTTTCQPLPLTFTDDEHISGRAVAFSPNGKVFASAYSKNDITTLRMFEAFDVEGIALVFVMNRRKRLNFPFMELIS